MRRMGSPPNDVHVRFESRYGWTVRCAGMALPHSAHGTQGEAERLGRLLAQRERGCLIVHSFAGDVIRRDSYTFPT